MGAKLGISYEYKSEGCSVISFPPDMPFAGCLDELTKVNIKQIDKSRFNEISLIDGIYKRFEEITDFMSISENASRDIIYIASLAASGEPLGIRMFYTLLIAIASMDTIVDKYADFFSLKNIMQQIEDKEMSGKDLAEKEIWFRKQVLFLSGSYPLPGPSDAEHPWLAWEINVRKALADPDERWDEAIRKRIMAELEARRLRISRIVSSMNPEVHSRLLTELINESEDAKWIKSTLEIPGSLSGGSTLLIRKKLENQWEGIIASLKESEPGKLLADIFEYQAAKAHSYPQIKIGTSVLKAIFKHPILSRLSSGVDLLSCLYHFVRSAGKGKMELLMSSGRIDKELLNIPGFKVEEDLLSVNLESVRTDMFVGDYGEPVEFDWSKPIEESSVSYKSLVLSYIDNTTFLTGLLNNPKIAGKPGVVELIASRCKATSVLSLIAGRRDLYTGFANKNVPLILLMNPARISISSLRKFIHVKYVDKMTLQQLANRRGKGGQIREEVRREIDQMMTKR
jgi:hypothetical protein